MKQLRCKMCGGTLHINESQTTAVCEFCGSTQALPKVGSDAKTALVQRAEDYRRANEFDRALELYEKAKFSRDSAEVCRTAAEVVEAERNGTARSAALEHRVAKALGTYEAVQSDAQREEAAE